MIKAHLGRMFSEDAAASDKIMGVCRTSILAGRACPELQSLSKPALRARPGESASVRRRSIASGALHMQQLQLARRQSWLLSWAGSGGLK